MSTTNNKDSNTEVQNSHRDVLLVEDSLINQKIFSYYLTGYNISFAIVGNGFEAIAILKKERFKLILLDIELPKMDGYAITKQVRNVLNINTPIVAITAYPIDEIKGKCFAFGMNACCSKPIERTELAGILTQFLPKKTNSKHQVSAETQRNYEVIDLSYLREVSMGNKGYEKEVTIQFIQIIPHSLNLINTYLEREEYDELKKVAHHLLSTIYIMGLRSRLEGYLNAIQHQKLTAEELKPRVEFINLVCEKAKVEAQLFLETLEMD